MNDKNFIEELRQKREEYGVTQTRLAVACGISREYYNRIEKGKQPLNDELREIIEKQIERFNPQEPLFLLIDYFRVRFPTTDALAIIRDVLQLKSNYMLYEDYGKYGYESKYVLGDINIMCSMQEHLGVLLELKGKGCRQMECYLLAQERSWYDFMLDCMTAGAADPHICCHGAFELCHGGRKIFQTDGSFGKYGFLGTQDLNIRSSWAKYHQECHCPGHRYLCQTDAEKIAGICAGDRFDLVGGIGSFSGGKRCHTQRHRGGGSGRTCDPGCRTLVQSGNHDIFLPGSGSLCGAGGR